MLTYDMEKREGIPLYQHLYHCIRKDIDTGVIKPDERLPSKRTLALHLQISVMTVQNAYAQLLAEGYLYTKERRGYFVSRLEQTPDLRRSKDRKETVPEKNEAEHPSYFADFCDNSVRPELFPFSVWSSQMREVLSEGGGELLRRMPQAGVYDLREAIAEYLHRFRGMSVSPEQIFIGAGTEYLYILLVQFFGRNKIYAVEDPGYKKIKQTYESVGAVCRAIPLDGEGISMSCLGSAGAEIVHISPSHHFPTGIVTPIKRRRELLRWAAGQSGRYIIEDDYDSEFRFTGRVLPTMQSIDTCDTVIYMNTFCKTISPALRISYMVLPPTLAQEFRSKFGQLSCTVSSLEQYTLAKFIQKGHFERHINRMRKAYKDRRDAILRVIFEGPLGNKVFVREEHAGLHFTMKVKTSLDDQELVRRAYENGIKISCLSQYCDSQESTESSVCIINYSGVRTEDAEKAMHILSKIL